MIDIEIINKIKEWGFDIEKEYQIIKEHHGVIGINEHLANENQIYDLWLDIQEYLGLNYDELIKKLKTRNIYITYKLYHDYAEELVILGDYLADEFEEYLKDNEIELENWQSSDVEEFFEQYGIEVY